MRWCRRSWHAAGAARPKPHLQRPSGPGPPAGWRHSPWLPAPRASPSIAAYDSILSAMQGSYIIIVESLVVRLASLAD